MYVRSPHSAGAYNEDLTMTLPSICALALLGLSQTALATDTEHYIPMDMSSDAFVPGADGVWTVAYPHAESLTFEILVTGTDAGFLGIANDTGDWQTTLSPGRHRVQIDGSAARIAVGGGTHFSIDGFTARTAPDDGNMVSQYFTVDMAREHFPVGDGALVVSHGDHWTYQFNVELVVDDLPRGGSLVITDGFGNSQRLGTGQTVTRAFRGAQVAIAVEAYGEVLPASAADFDVLRTSGYRLSRRVSTEGVSRVLMDQQNAYAAGRSTDFVDTNSALGAVALDLDPNELVRLSNVVADHVWLYGAEGLEHDILQILEGLARAYDADGRETWYAADNLISAYFAWFSESACGYPDANMWLAPVPGDAARLTGSNVQPILYWVASWLSSAERLGEFELLSFTEALMGSFIEACDAGFPGLRHPAEVTGTAVCGGEGHATSFLVCPGGGAGGFSKAAPAGEDHEVWFGSGWDGTGILEFAPPPLLDDPAPDEPLPNECDDNTTLLAALVERNDQDRTVIVGEMTTANSELTPDVESLFDCVDAVLEEAGQDVCDPDFDLIVLEQIADVCMSSLCDLFDRPQGEDPTVPLPADMHPGALDGTLFGLLADTCTTLHERGEDGGPIDDNECGLSYGHGAILDPHSCEELPLRPDGTIDLDGLLGSDHMRRVIDDMACMDAIAREARNAPDPLSDSATCALTKIGCAGGVITVVGMGWATLTAVNPPLGIASSLQMSGAVIGATVACMSIAGACEDDTTPAPADDTPAPAPSPTPTPTPTPAPADDPCENGCNEVPVGDGEVIILDDDGNPVQLPPPPPPTDTTPDPLSPADLPPECAHLEPADAELTGEPNAEAPNSDDPRLINPSEQDQCEDRIEAFLGDAEVEPHCDPELIQTEEGECPCSDDDMGPEVGCVHVLDCDETVSYFDEAICQCVMHEIEEGDAPEDGPEPECAKCLP